MKKPKTTDKSTKKCMWINAILHARMKTAAARQGLSLQVWIENACAEKIQRDGEK
jgi:predicted HicB family RNase H-like nuclease